MVLPRTVLRGDEAVRPTYWRAAIRRTVEEEREEEMANGQIVPTATSTQRPTARTNGHLPQRLQARNIDCVREKTYGCSSGTEPVAPGDSGDRGRRVRPGSGSDDPSKPSARAWTGRLSGNSSPFSR